MLNVILFLIYLLRQCRFLLNIFRSLFCLVCVLFTYLDLFIYLRLLGPSPLISKPNCPIHSSNTPLPKTPKITPHFFSHTRHACLLGENSLHVYFTMLPLARLFLIHPLAKPLLSFHPTCIWKPPPYTTIVASHQRKKTRLAPI